MWAPEPPSPAAAAAKRQPPRPPSPPFLSLEDTRRNKHFFPSQHFTGKSPQIYSDFQARWSCKTFLKQQLEESHGFVFTRRLVSAAAAESTTPGEECERVCRSSSSRLFYSPLGLWDWTEGRFFPPIIALPLEKQDLKKVVVVRGFALTWHEIFHLVRFIILLNRRKISRICWFHRIALCNLHKIKFGLSWSALFTNFIFNLISIDLPLLCGPSLENHWSRHFWHNLLLLERSKSAFSGKIILFLISD